VKHAHAVVLLSVVNIPTKQFSVYM